MPQGRLKTAAANASSAEIFRLVITPSRFFTTRTAAANSNQILSFVGYPLEGYGFSNNVNPQFKAPGFDECKFHYDGKGWKQIPVTMIYR
jgi:hypothetical protein